MLRQILALAKRQGLVENNYETVDYIEYPKSKSNPIPTMNEVEMKELCDAIMAYPLRNTIKSRIINLLLYGL